MFPLITLLLNIDKCSTLISSSLQLTANWLAFIRNSSKFWCYIVDNTTAIYYSLLEYESPFLTNNLTIDQRDAHIWLIKTFRCRKFMSFTRISLLSIWKLHHRKEESLVIAIISFILYLYPISLFCFDID